MWLIIFFYSTVAAGLQHYIHDNAEEMSQEKVRAGLNPCVKWSWICLWAEQS